MQIFPRDFAQTIECRIRFLTCNFYCHVNQFTRATHLSPCFHSFTLSPFCHGADTYFYVIFCRQAALLEKKRQKKLRQKEQRAKELEGVETDDSPEDSSPSPPTSSPSDAYDSNPEVPETSDSPTSSPESMQIGNDATGMYEYHENEYSDLGTYQRLEHRMSHQNSRRYMTNSRWQAPKLRKIPNGFHANHNYQALKYGPIQKLASHRDFRIATASNGGKVWTPKPKSQIDGDSHKTRLQIEANLPGQDKKHELLIGSISVALGCCSSQKHGENIGRALGTSALAHPMQSKKDSPERPDKIEVAQAIGDHSTVNSWKPVGQGGQLSVQNCSDASEVIVPCDNEEVLQSCKAENKSNDCEENLILSVQGGYQGALRFSSDVAEAFLSKSMFSAPKCVFISEMSGSGANLPF